MAPQGPLGGPGRAGGHDADCRVAPGRACHLARSRATVPPRAASMARARAAQPSCRLLRPAASRAASSRRAAAAARPRRRPRRAAGREMAAGCRPGPATGPGGSGSTLRGSAPRPCSRAGGRACRGRSRAPGVGPEYARQGSPLNRSCAGQRPAARVGVAGPTPGLTCGFCSVGRRFTPVKWRAQTREMGREAGPCCCRAVVTGAGRVAPR